MSSYGRYYRPALKNSVDVQLQTAFSDGNWPTVIRLAAKRAQSLKDPYYEAIRACAESQLDGPSERSAAVFAVDALARNPAAVPDVETLELYEWACREAEPPINYSETIGALRSRWVKANPRSVVGIECLKACIENWDLVNAQQIAATLDKAAPNTKDRRYMFWNVTLTYLLSISPQCPEGKAKIYGMLASKQLERAAEVAETAKDLHAADRSLREEEEIILFYNVLEAQSSPDALLKSMHSPTIGALQQFDDGRKYLFLRGLATFANRGEWDVVFDFCSQALEKKDSDGSPSFLASDWRVWKVFVEAASRQSDEQTAFATIQERLQNLGSVKTKVAQMYVKNIGLASVELAFRLPASLLPLNNKDLPTPRVLQICLFLDQQFDKISLFDDLKQYVGELSYEEAGYLLDVMIPKISEKITDRPSKVKAVSLKVLAIKFRYYLTTCPQTLVDTPSLASGDDIGVHLKQCRTCASKTAGPCSRCLRRIVVESMLTYRDLEGGGELAECAADLDRHPQVDLSLVVGVALLKLAGLRKRRHSKIETPLRTVNVSYLLQAAVLLDSQLVKTPNEVPLRLLLVQLHLILGCASYAYQLWIPMDVKRTIQDALSPLFFDRLSSISPGLFHGDRRPLMEPLRSYYHSSLREKAPVKIWDAFSAGSYSAILDMVEYMDRLRRSCTLVMTVVEERRATRAFGGKLDGAVDDVPVLSEVNDTATLVNVTDYGSLPNLESSFVPPLAELVRLGPELSNERSHLALLTEQYLDIIDFKAPKDYRPSKANDVAVKETAAAVESVARIQQAMAAFLHSEGLSSKLTGPEEAYYTAISLLSSMLLLAFSTERSGTVSPSFVLSTSTLKATLDTLQTAYLAVPASSDSKLHTLFVLTDHQTLSAIRDISLAIKHTVAFMQAFNERETARDRSGKSGLHKEVMAEARALDILATKSLATIKNRIKGLKEALGQGGWLDQMTEWTFGAASEDEEGQALSKAVSDVVGTSPLEDWAGRVVESWREGVKGWGMVKLE